jgi:hypothetical protein
LLDEAPAGLPPVGGEEKKIKRLKEEIQNEQT